MCATDRSVLQKKKKNAEGVTLSAQGYVSVHDCIINDASVLCVIKKHICYTAQREQRLNSLGSFFLENA